MKRMAWLVMMMMASVSSWAQMDLVVEVLKEGTLEDVVYDISDSAKYNTVSMKVIGPIDGRDMMFIRDMCGVKDLNTPTQGMLKILDLSDAFIVESSQKYLSMDGTDYTTKDGHFGCCFLYNCSALEEVYLPMELSSIDSLALAGCSKLTNVDIPASVERIGYGAFYGCENITSIIVPNGVFELQTGAFQEMKNMKELYLGDGVVEINNSLILGDDSLAVIYFGVGFEKFNPVVFYTAPSLNYIYVSEGNPHFHSIDGVLFSNNCDTLFTFPVASTMVDYQVPEGVTTIAPCAFYNAQMLHSVSCPSSLNRIDTLAFFGCSSLEVVQLGENLQSICFGAFGMPLEHEATLRQLVLPSSVSHIDGGAFLFNTTLEQLTVNGNPYFSTDDYGALYDKTFQTLIYVPGKVEEYKLPETVTAIGDYAFAGLQNLPFISLGDQVGIIGNGAFTYSQGIHELFFGIGVHSVGSRIVDGCHNIQAVYWFPNKIDDKNISEHAFDDEEGCVKQHCHLYVLPGMTEYYSKKKGFASAVDGESFFASIVEMENADGMKENVVHHEGKTVYSIDGIRYNSAIKGLNVIQLPDGTTYKKVEH